MSDPIYISMDPDLTCLKKNGECTGSGTSKGNELNAYGNSTSQLISSHEGNSIVDASYQVAYDLNMDHYPLVPLEVIITTYYWPYTIQSNISIAGRATGNNLSPVTWRNSNTGGTGTCQGGSEWQADIPLGLGENFIMFTATDANGISYSPTMRVFREAATPTGKDVAITTPVNVQFFRQVDTSSVSIEVHGVEGTISWAGSNVSFTPIPGLAYGTTYSVTCKGVDLNGNDILYEWSFTTVKDECTLTGTVRDQDSKPVASATVTLSNGMLVTTDENGRFEFTTVPSGIYTMNVTMAGYEGWSGTIEAVAGEAVSVGILNVRSNEALTSAAVLLLGVIAVSGVALLAFLERARWGRKQ